MAKKKSPKEFKFQLNDEDWTCFLWTPKAYEKEHGDDSDAITLPPKREVHFRTDNLSLELVGHELMHCFWEGLYLDHTSTIPLSDVEEIMAAFMGANFVKFYDKANLIFETLNGKIK